MNGTRVGTVRPPVSIVVPSRNEERLLATVTALLETGPPGAEVIVVDDGSTDASADAVTAHCSDARVVRLDASLGEARARNLGARLASGDVIVHADAHLLPPAGWFDPLAEILADAQVGVVGPAVAVMGEEALRGYGRTWRRADLTSGWLPRAAEHPYAVPLLGGFFMALRREVVERTGGFDEGLIQWGATDAELCMRLWSLGYECVVAPDVVVAHLFRRRFPYPVDGIAQLHNRIRVAVVHLGGARLRLALDQLLTTSDGVTALSLALERHAGVRRAEVQAARTRSDDEFFQRFGISFDRPAVAA